MEEEHLHCKGETNVAVRGAYNVPFGQASLFNGLRVRMSWHGCDGEAGINIVFQIREKWKPEKRPCFLQLTSEYLIQTTTFGSVCYIFFSFLDFNGAKTLSPSTPVPDILFSG